MRLRGRLRGRGCGCGWRSGVRPEPLQSRALPPVRQQASASAIRNLPASVRGGRRYAIVSIFSPALTHAKLDSTLGSILDRLEQPIASLLHGGEPADERVKPLELFFDLVFVFGLTQVTTMLSADPTWGGLLRGVLVLGAIWWAWAAYAWLTNTLNLRKGSSASRCSA